VGKIPQPGLARRVRVKKNLRRKSEKFSTQKTCQEKSKKKSKKNREIIKKKLARGKKIPIL